MLRSPLTRWIVGLVAFIAILGLVRFKPWQHRSGSGTLSGGSNAALQELKVGYLPVTCHLTCPVTDFATRTSTTNRFESQRFTDFPTVVESVKGGRLDATFMIAPLAMKLREQGVPVKIVYLGHRDGSTVIVRKDLPAESLRDLVRVIAESGEWAEGHRLEAAKVVAPYFRQDEKVIRYVLTQPPDRVSYRMLTPTDTDLQQINDMAVKAGILERPISMKDLIDRQFIPLDIKPAKIDVGQP